MGILRAGQKKYKDIGYTKDIRTGRIGWKRIAKNIIRFGWEYIDDDGGSDINLPPTRAGKHRVKLSFVRANCARDAQPKAVRTLEFFYNLIFLLRRIALFLLPVFAVAGIVVSVVKSMDGLSAAIAFIFVDLVVWIACIITEEILSRCAASKLKKMAEPVRRNKSGRRSVASGNFHRDPQEDEDDDIVTLMTAKGEEVDFVEVAGIAYRGNFYAVLQPVELLEGMEEDEALVFRVSRDAAGGDKFEVEVNEEIVDAVFAEYNRLLDEAENNG